MRKTRKILKELEKECEENSIREIFIKALEKNKFKRIGIDKWSFNVSKGGKSVANITITINKDDSVQLEFYLKGKEVVEVGHPRNVQELDEWIYSVAERIKGSL